VITYSIGLKNKFRGITVREGMLYEGPAGWAEWSPFLDYDDATCVSWLRAAREAGSRTLVLQECTASGQITLARLRDLAGCGRRDAQLLLERLDADGVTRRLGEARVLRRRSSAPAS